MKTLPIVLFLDRTNSDRSLIAEALLRRHAGRHLEVHSAGIEPTGVSPVVAKVLAEIGIRGEELRSKSVSEFLGRIPVTYAILLGERDEPESPRLYPFATRTLRWECPDPSRETVPAEQRLRRTRETRAWLDARIREWASTTVTRAA